MDKDEFKITVSFDKLDPSVEGILKLSEGIERGMTMPPKDIRGV